MVSDAAIHALTAELHTGFLFLAAISILLVAVALIALRLWPTKDGRMARLARMAIAYLEPTGAVAALAGVIALIISAYTGMFAWSDVNSVLDDPVTRNKIILTSIITVLWTLVVVTRVRFGRNLWKLPSLATVYVVMAMVAFGLTAFTGSMGAHLAQGGSFIDPILQTFGIDYTKDLALSPELSATMAGVSAIIIVVCIFLMRRGGKRMSDVVAEATTEPQVVP